MTEETYRAITRVAREFRAQRNGHSSRRVEAASRDLYQNWPELWQALNTLQREWLE